MRHCRKEVLMKISKKVTALVLGTAMTCSSLAFAQIPANQISLGGVEPGIGLEAAKRICGAPIYADDDVMIFGNGLIVKIDDKRPGIVDEVLCKQASDAATPAGITIGMAEETLSRTYGQADKIDRDYDDTEYTYRSTDRSKKLEFKVKNGIIVKISCDLRD